MILAYMNTMFELTGAVIATVVLVGVLIIPATLLIDFIKHVRGNP